MKRVIFCLVLFVLLVGSVNAMVISGEIYGPDFELVEEVLVKISSDSGVLSSMVSKNGEYSFEVESGNYIIEAEVFDNGVIIFAGEEEIEVSEVELEIDLVVLPFIDENFDFDVDTNIEDNGNFLIISVIIILVILILFYLNKKGLLKLERKGKKEDLPKDLRDMIKLIEKKGKRINQVDLRSELPYSEAKVSLMISDLEERGLIKRIKKGRGNILILK